MDHVTVHHVSVGCPASMCVGLPGARHPMQQLCGCMRMASKTSTGTTCPMPLHAHSTCFERSLLVFLEFAGMACITVWLPLVLS